MPEKLRNAKVFEVGGRSQQKIREIWVGGKRKQMPYTHYWRRSAELPPDEFAKFAKDVTVAAEAMAEIGIPLAGPTGEGDLIATNECVAFNGLSDCGHRYQDLGYPWPGPESKGVVKGRAVVIGTHASEQGPILASRGCGGNCAGRIPMGRFFIDRVFLARAWDQLENGRYFQFCETDFKPYDLAVMIVLIRAKERMPNDFYLSSDGTEFQWEEAKNLNRELFGWGSRFVLTPLEEL